MFGLFKKSSVHEPVEKQREDVEKRYKEALGSAAAPIREILKEAMLKILNGLDCDQLPSGKGAFGSLENPIPVNGSIGEIKYLAKLRGKTGEALMFHRTCSVESSVTGDHIDCYEIVCLDGTQWNDLYFDCHHPRRSNLCPPGYTLVPVNKSLGMDIPFGFGCDSIVSKFPYGLPDAIVKQYGEFGVGLARRIEERLKKYSFERPPSKAKPADNVLFFYSKQ